MPSMTPPTTSISRRRLSLERRPSTASAPDGFLASISAIRSASPQIPASPVLIQRDRSVGPTLPAHPEFTIIFSVMRSNWRVLLCESWAKVYQRRRLMYRRVGCSSDLPGERISRRLAQPRSSHPLATHGWTDTQVVGPDSANRGVGQWKSHALTTAVI